MVEQLDNLEQIAKDLRAEIDELRREKLEARLDYDPVEAVARGMAERMAFDWGAEWDEDCDFPDKYDFREMARCAIRILAGGGIAPWSGEEWRMSPSRPQKRLTDKLNKE